MRKTYSPEFKARVVREILKEERTLSQIAAHYEIHPNLAAQWRDQALTGLVEIFSKAKEADWQGKAAAYEQEKKELYAQIGRLTTQLTWLKKKASSSGSRKERLAMLERA